MIGFSFRKASCRVLCRKALLVYNTGEPQRAANSPRLSNRLGGWVFLLGLLVLADREPLHYFHN